MKQILTAFIDPETEESKKGFVVCWLTLLLLVVLIGWGIFLNFGDIPLDFHDWAEVNAPRLAFLKDAMMKGELPLHMPDDTALRGVTDRYMALPDMILSPQVILLKWLSVGSFVMVNTWLQIAVGYWGLLRLKKRFSLSLLSFTWIAVLFYFNGHILSHYSVGHVTWGGYFLLSWFMELVYALIDGERGAIWETKMAFLLFIFFLQGSFHQFVWCVIFLGFLAISNWKTFWPILRSGIAAALLSAVRIIPPALQMGAFDAEFLGRYTGTKQFINAFIKIISPDNALNQAKTGAVLGWWEFDIYIGIAGALFLLVGALAWILLRQKELGFPSLICPAAVLVIFSRFDFSLIQLFFRLPLFSGERVRSRFLILPFVFILVSCVTALQRFLKEKNWTWANLLTALFVIPAAAFLWKHLNAWKVTEAVKSFPYTYTDLTIKTVANHPDPAYTTGLLVGMGITVLTAVLLIIRVQKSKKHSPGN